MGAVVAVGKAVAACCRARGAVGPRGIDQVRFVVGIEKKNITTNTAGNSP